MKKALTLASIVAAAFAWSVATASASYSSLDALKPAKHGAKPTKIVKIVERPPVTRVIYIYSPGPAVAPTPLTPAEQCAADNEDLIAHALDPVDCTS
jgi:hypothetical protein